MVLRIGTPNGADRPCARHPYGLTHSLGWLMLAQFIFDLERPEAAHEFTNVLWALLLRNGTL